MKLCVPLSDAFLSRSGELLPLVDAVSFKEPRGESYPGKEHFLECSYNIADPAFRNRLESSGYLDALGSRKYASFACDLGPNCAWRIERSLNGFPRSVPVSPPISDEEYLERVLRNVAWIRREYSGFVQVENLNYFPTGAYERVCEPAFVSRVAETADLGLLLDIGHVAVSVHYLEYGDDFSYLEALPLHRVREVQLSHSGCLKDVFEDLHEVPGEQEFRWVRRMVQMGYDIQYLTVEYYRDADKLCDVYRFLHGEKPTHAK